MSAKPKIGLRSIPWVCRVDEYVRTYVKSTDITQFASDSLDGWAKRHELDDLIRRGFMRVVPLPDCHPWQDRDMCGSSWTVDLTRKAVRTFWPHRQGGVA